MVAPVFNFIHSGTLQVSWGLRVDALTAVMLVVVAAVCPAICSGQVIERYAVTAFTAAQLAGAPADHWAQRDPDYEQKLLVTYYQFKGWNKEGIPTRETLADLGLDYIGQEFEQSGILTN